MSPKIGFIGLGIMGSRMAANLIKAGNEVVVYNRTRSKAGHLLDAGAQWAEDPNKLASQVEVVFTMLSEPAAVKEVALGDKGFLEAMPEDGLWVDISTVNPSFSRNMAREALRFGVTLVDAPVAGSLAPAEKGELIFLVGGTDRQIGTLQPYFDAMGRKTVHAGSQGQGAALKLVFNLLLGQAMAAFSEAMALGLAQGLDKNLLLEVMTNSPVTAPFIQSKRSKIEEDRFEAEFPLQWMHKDLHLAALTAFEQGISLPALNAVKEIFARAGQSGWGEEDFSAVIKTFTSS